MRVVDLVPPVAPASPAAVVPIVIVDRHSLFARGLQAALEEASIGRLSVVAHTDGARAALDLVRRHRPRLVVVDLDLAEPGGLEAIDLVRRRFPGVRVAAMAADAAPGPALSALAAGADGVLLRDATPEAVAAQLLAIVAGASVAPPQALASLLRRRPEDAAIAQLRRADIELWRLVSEGHETTVIARRLCVSERTAKRMVARLLQRLGAANRVQAAALAGRYGVLDELRPRRDMESP